jgi:hypothetical protein
MGPAIIYNCGEGRGKRIRNLRVRANNQAPASEARNGYHASTFNKESKHAPEDITNSISTLSPSWNIPANSYQSGQLADANNSPTIIELILHKDKLKVEFPRPPPSAVILAKLSNAEGSSDSDVEPLHLDDARSATL